METNNETFSYVYSPKQQEEIENIRKKYLPEDEAEDKMEQLRRLDRNAVKPGTAASLIIGIIGALTLGAGMCCTMVWGGQLFIPGIGIGLAGIVLLLAAYPVYAKITRKRRHKIAPEILRLTDELRK